MIELQAVATCDRCGCEVNMMDVDDMAEAERRIHEAGWCEEEQNGELVCDECWAKWDSEHVTESATAVGAVDPQGGTSNA